jgi:phytoene synthase
VPDVDTIALHGSIDDVVRIAARAYERDRYLAALLAPRTFRADLIAVAAFGGEIARIPSHVTEPTMGEVRLQWWRDALAAAAKGAATGHPIADAVGTAMRRHGIPLDLAGQVTEAVSLRLSDAPPADDEALRSHLARTEGALFTLAWRILAGPSAGPDPELLASAGQTYGLARTLYEFPAVLAQGRTLVPQTRLDNSGVSLDILRSGGRPDVVRALLAELAVEARSRLAGIAPVLRRASPTLRTALLPIALVEPYLRSFEKQRYHRPSSIAEISPLTRVWRIWLAHRIGRI